MAYTRTLADMDSAVRSLGQWENSADITPFVMFQALNYALIEGYDIMVGKWADYYTTSVVFPVVAGTDTYSLDTITTSNFYKLRHLDVSADGVRYVRAYPHDLEVAHRYSASSQSSSILRVRYRLAAARSLVFAPVPPAGFAKIYFIPMPVQFASEDDLDPIDFDVPVEEDLVVHLAQRRLLMRSDLSTQTVDIAIQRLTAQLRTAADNRDAGEPHYLNPNGPRREWSPYDEDSY